MMKEKVYVLKRMDALFIELRQLDGLLDQKLTTLLGHSVHPRSYEDEGCCEIITDEFTPDEMLRLLKLGKANDADRKDHAPYAESGRIKDMTAAFAVKLLQPELLFPADRILAVEDGIYLLGKAAPVVKKYKN